MFGPGDPIPSFFARGAGNPRYSFDSVAGRHVVVMFVASSRVPGVREMVASLHADSRWFDDKFTSLFIVSNDPQDEATGALSERYPGIRVFWDTDRRLAQMFGASRPSSEGERISLTSWILDPALRVLDVIPIDNPATHLAQVAAALGKLPHPAEAHDSSAPVLVVPNILEPAFCRELLDYCAAQGVEDSGYMQTDPRTGQTIMVVDHHHKRRSDCSIESEPLRQGLQARIVRRLVPQIERAFQFKATRMERYIISRYDAETGGHFRPHKDNTTLGTAHRRFAVSIGLNAEEYDGGDLRFPEFGPRTYRPPTGGAVVFSCSLLHEATPVTRGQRYAVLPFLYDEAAAALRLKNARHLGDAELRKSVVASVTAKPQPSRKHKLKRRIANKTSEAAK
jgi:predicted 2-oxoglutarate/Fe(II)-dependent dioxygenase YbiX/peroxiredoxin